jgi:hypothetical protein
MNLVKTAAAVAAAFSLAACATIVGSPSQTLPISSTPAGAQIEIVDEKGVSVFKGATPTTVTLQKSDGSYFGGKTYTVKLRAPGHADTDVTVKAQANAWYIAGNFVFGGLIGWLIVDPLSGAMYTLSPDTVGQGMEAAKSADGGIRVTLISELSPQMLEKLVKVN